MSGGSHIVAVEAEAGDRKTSEQDQPIAEELAPLDPPPWEEVDDAVGSHTKWIVFASAVLAVAGWTAFFGSAHWQELRAGPSLQQWSELVTSWTIPVLLVLAIWLVAMRSSRREAARFGNVARELARESALLEHRLITVNRELSLAREFVAAQSRDLDSLGRVATERLSQHASELERLIHDNSNQIDSIAAVSKSALDNMDKLRGELPVIANSARDVTSQIGNAGRTANAHLDELVSGFHRLNEFGEASERQVTALRAKIDSALMGFESQASRLEDMTGRRYDLLDERGQKFGAQLKELEAKAFAALEERAEALKVKFDSSWSDFDSRQSASLASLRERLDTLRQDSQEFEGSMRESQEGALTSWSNSIDALGERLTATLSEIASIEAGALERIQAELRHFKNETDKLDNEMAQRSERSVRETSDRLTEVDALISERHQEYIAKLEEFVQRGDELGKTLAGFGAQVESLSTQGRQVSGEFAEGVERISSSLEASKGAIQTTKNELGDLTEASIRLLELIRAGEEHSQTRLPDAIAAAEEKLVAVEERTIALGQQLTHASEKGRLLSDRVLMAERDGTRAIEEFDRLQSRLSELGLESRERIDSLRAGLSELTRECEVLSRKVDGELSEAIQRIQSSMRTALSDLGSGHNELIGQSAENIGVQSAEAIERAIRRRAADAISDLERAAAQASGASRDAARQLRDQLQMVAELTDNLEARVVRARERAQEQVDNDFAHRVALITESLNSNAIDIAKAMSSDVSDTAWASYLRGDRGIFTRRAVRLLDNSEAREIADLYDRDPGFKEHVSRYIHDFEAILRTMLSTRDGKALGVTLLSSDMGKLYVALAQAIERLRT